MVVGEALLGREVAYALARMRVVMQSVYPGFDGLGHFLSLVVVLITL